MPATELHLEIIRGLRFLGQQGICLDEAGDAVVFNEGTTATLQARKKPGDAVAFTLPVEIGEEDGQLIISPVSSDDTPDLPLGLYQFAITLTDGDGEITGPHTIGTITVTSL